MTSPNNIEETKANRAAERANIVRLGVASYVLKSFDNRTAELLAAEQRAIDAGVRNQDGNSQGYDRVPAEVRGLI